MITPNRLGHFPVICTELCGLGHSLMRSWSFVMTKAAYAAWYLSSPQPAPSPTGGAGVSAGALIFTSNGCSACHTFTPIPAATGKVGPSLDDLTAAAKKAGQPLEDYIQPVDRRPERLHHARLPARRDARVVQPHDRSAHQHRSARAVSGQEHEVTKDRR